jgi:hypothetical protein
MTKFSKENPLLNRVFGIFLQVVFIFIFLTIFFFSYVGESEKESFKKQMNIVVDDLAPDFNVRQYVKDGYENFATVVIEGSLELARKKADKDSTSEDDAIKQQNNQIKKEAYKWLFICIGILVFIIICIVLSGGTVPFHIHMKDAAIVVFFVAATEFIFLNLITANYWSVDPSEVRRNLGDSIQQWIQQHHPVE